MLTSGWSPCCLENKTFEKAPALVYKILKALSIRAACKNGLNLPDRLEIRSWRSTARPPRVSHTRGQSNWSKQEAIKFICCFGLDRAWSLITVSDCWELRACTHIVATAKVFTEWRINHIYVAAFFFLQICLIAKCWVPFIFMHALQASHSSSRSTSCAFLSALVFCIGTASYSYLFIFSSYRSELFFHPVLLHETRTPLKASLLFSVCP